MAGFRRSLDRREPLFLLLRLLLVAVDNTRHNRRDILQKKNAAGCEMHIIREINHTRTWQLLGRTPR